MSFDTKDQMIQDIIKEENEQGMPVPREFKSDVDEYKKKRDHK